MKILDKKDIEELLVENSMHTRDPIIDKIIDLGVGSGILLPFDEWTKKTSLGVYIGNYKIRNGLNVSVRKIRDKGYLIIKK
tara:strand:+ start:1113 stop:1355 length:243 start_codon:yes stop_codon:yes gene_type:complete